LSKGIWKLQRRSNDAGDEDAICIASVAGLDALKQCYALSPVQVDTEKVFEKFEPLKHRGSHRSPERTHRLRLGI
jgi:hypothetical protein